MWCFYAVGSVWFCSGVDPCRAGVSLTQALFGSVAEAAERTQGGVAVGLM